MTDFSSLLENPALKEAGISSLFGFCSGYAVKQISRLVAIGVGLGFIGVQVAQKKGYIEQPDWAKMNTEFMKHADVNGDGKVDAADLKAGITGIQDYLGVGMPSVGGFGAGFMFGLYVG